MHEKSLLIAPLLPQKSFACCIWNVDRNQLILAVNNSIVFDFRKNKVTIQHGADLVRFHIKWFKELQKKINAGLF